jgi:hypothetical protein
MHIEKIIPLIIAIALIYLNTRKKSKKPVTTSKTPPEKNQPSQNPPGHGVLDPFFKGIDDILNINQPVVQISPEPEPQVKKTKQKKEPVIIEPANIQVPTAKIVLHEPLLEVEHFDFDAKRAIIDAEIMNRKYFTI